MRHNVIIEIILGIGAIGFVVGIGLLGLSFGQSLANDIVVHKHSLFMPGLICLVLASVLTFFCWLIRYFLPNNNL